jgi:hypothetical protein
MPDEEQESRVDVSNASDTRPVTTASATEPSPSPCEGDCNPFVATCGARFCSYEAMTHHEWSRRQSPAAGRAPERGC